MNLRKHLLLTVALCTFTFNTTSAQTTFDGHIGVSPAQNIGSQEIRINCWNGEAKGALRPSRQSAGITAGLGITHDLESGFFLRGELQYIYSKTQFVMRDVTPTSERLSTFTFDVANHVLALPLSVGVRLGSFRVLSGVNVNAALKSTTALARLDNFYDNSSSLYMGWHAGLEYDLGNIGLEVRYSNDFRNYGQGYSVGEKELIFYGNRNRWTVLVKYYIGKP
jgi:outer membrane protein with beta-barrel domain